MVGKKRSISTAITGEPSANQTDITDSVTTDSETKETKKVYCFKDPSYEASKGGPTAKRSRTWKTLKQIVVSERSLPWKPDDVIYSSIDGPPSFKPAKKYSDISGLPALYTDPQTKLRYTTSEEYSRIRLLPSDIVSGLLALRKANNPVT